MALSAIGIDGCPAGWVAALAHAAGDGRLERTELRLFRGDGRETIAALVDSCEALCRPPSLALDVPMGLPRRAGLRQCDREARLRLGRRASCVFPTVDRALFGLSFERCRELVRARRLAEPGRHPIMARQAIAIAPRIAALDALLTERPERQQWLVEAHPELSFLALARARGQLAADAQLPPKRSGTGGSLRAALIADALPDSEERIAAAPWPRREVARDDLLDAYAALWSALRHRAGTAMVLGGERDERGLLKRIVV
jgi:predicted RNase H-like nuclease